MKVGRIFKGSKKTIPVIKLEGVLTTSSGRGSVISFEIMRNSIDKAFAVKGAPFIILAINSPGGSPVQSARIGQYLRLKAKQKNIEIYAFCEDVAASGGYWLATSADKIYAMEASIIGSIGVISSMFGFTQLLEKIGVDRRVYSAGENKSQLDPFLPEDQQQVDDLKRLQMGVHEDFIQWVKSRRGEVLRDNPDLFTGKFWNGIEAKKLGLVDELAAMDTMLVEKFNHNYKIKTFGGGRRSIIKLLGGELLIEYALEIIFSKLSMRAYWERFGL